MPLYAQQLPTAKPINLLQGRYAPQNTRAVGWRAWRVAAILLAALVGLHVAGKAAELFMLKRAEKTVDASHRSGVPRRDAGRTEHASMRGAAWSDGSLACAAAAARRRTACLRSARSSQARSAAPGTTVQALSYRDGALDLKIAAPNADSLDRVSQSLREQRLECGPHRAATPWARATKAASRCARREASHELLAGHA